jgi:hypothetical protein
MRQRPWSSYAVPAYPTREQAAEDRALLPSHLPPAWQSDGRMAGAVAFLLTFASAGCRAGAEPIVPGGPEPDASAGAPVVAITPAPASTSGAGDPGPDTGRPSAVALEAMVVAPIFEHGDGRGATGCVVVAPPVFLSEEEALGVVREELGKHGVSLGRLGVELPGVRTSQRREHYRQNDKGEMVGGSVEEPGTAKALVVEGMSPDKHVAVKLVSENEYFALGGAISASSVQSYDFKGIATEVAQRLRQQGKEPLYVGVFYDPVSLLSFDHHSGPQPDGRLAQAELREKSKALLRRQVQDFVSWLRGRGAL